MEIFSSCLFICCYCGRWCILWRSINHHRFTYALACTAIVCTRLQKEKKSPCKAKNGYGTGVGTHTADFNQKASLFQCWTINLCRRWYDRIVVIMKYCPPFSVGMDRVNRVPSLLVKNLSRAHFTKHYTELADGHRFRCSFVYGQEVFLFSSFFRVPIPTLRYSALILRFSSEKNKMKFKHIFVQSFFPDPNLEDCCWFQSGIRVISHHLNGWFPSSYSNQFVYSYV